MRIISGKLKGRTIPVPKQFNGRPTTDFAREGLFNILSHLINYNGIRVLDLFAGTGAFSLECFSRGADSVTAVEQSAVHAKGINDNFKLFSATNATVIKADVFRYVQQKPGTFDLIFADPPFDLVQLSELPRLILRSGILSENGIFILEHPDTFDFIAEPGFDQHRRYGNVHFTFFRHLHL